MAGSVQHDVVKILLVCCHEFLSLTQECVRGPEGQLVLYQDFALSVSITFSSAKGTLVGHARSKRTLPF